ncbi:hypothetical protein AOZ06_16475 [Kibdelosporangium phytohabitans]|uniref:Uncharacterized protein n=2 Tax=Kibdelosporangium phytohabitans TaxID=860235 RepID=A0A0N9HMZ4_9PSEU|nr:hypothetical protein AOZ06_16475 [Kibdelosporangium phytohabitans]
MIGANGKPAGSIDRTGNGTSDATADLGDLELGAQVFAVVLLRWRRQRVKAGVLGATLARG